MKIFTAVVLSLIFGLIKNCTGPPSRYLNRFLCGDQPLDCNVEVEPGQPLSDLCTELSLKLSQTSADFGLLLYYQPGGCDIPDITTSFDNPAKLSVIGTVGTLNTTSVDLTGYSLALEVPCGPGFIMAVVYFTANGSYFEYLSLPINVNCANLSIEISLVGISNSVGEDQVLDAGTPNPFSVLGQTSVDISIEPEDAKISCDVIAVAFLFCEQQCLNNGSGPNLNQGYPIQIHNQSLVDQTTLKINLDLTSIPDDVTTGSCNLTLILDPLNDCPDVNPDNNKLSYRVNINGSNFAPKSFCDVIPDFASNGKDAILIQKTANMCKPRLTSFRKGQFMPQNKPGKQGVEFTKIPNTINTSQCGDLCNAIYKDYSTTKSPCPRTLLEPLYQIFKGSSSSWDSVIADDEDVKQDLENFKSISLANTFLMEKILNDETYSKLCPHVIKLLFNAYSVIQGKSRSFDEENGGHSHHKDDFEDHESNGSGENQGDDYEENSHNGGKRGKNQMDGNEENSDSHGKRGMAGNGKAGKAGKAGKDGQNGKDNQNGEDIRTGGKEFKTSLIGNIIESLFVGSSDGNNSKGSKGSQGQSIVGEDFSGSSKSGSVYVNNTNLNVSSIVSLLKGLEDKEAQAILGGNNSSVMKELTETVKQVLNIAIENGQGLSNNSTIQDVTQLNQSSIEKHLGGADNITNLLSILKNIHSNMTIQANNTGNHSSQSPNTETIKNALKNILDSSSIGQVLAGINLLGSKNGSSSGIKNSLGGSQGKSDQGKVKIEIGKRRKRSSGGDHMNGNQNIDQHNDENRRQLGKGSKSNPNQGKRRGGHPLKDMINYFPFGAWNWGLPDLGLVSGKPNCAMLNPNCQNSKRVLDSWYSDCVCPWVWSGKSASCPFGIDENSIVAKANILYLKNKPNFPRIRPPFKVFENFSSSIQSSPVDQNDIDILISSYSEFLQAESNSSFSLLMQSYLDNLSPQFKESLFNLIKEIQGLTMFERLECDWWGEPGPSPSTEELCRAHLGRNAHLKMECKHQQQLNGGEDHGAQDRGPEPCQSKDGADDLPKIWRKFGSIIKRGSYCQLTGQWFWTDIASCGGGMKKCQSCKGAGFWNHQDQDQGQTGQTWRMGGGSQNQVKRTNSRNGFGDDEDQFNEESGSKSSEGESMGGKNNFGGRNQQTGRGGRHGGKNVNKQHGDAEYSQYGDGSETIQQGKSGSKTHEGNQRGVSTLDHTTDSNEGDDYQDYGYSGKNGGSTQQGEEYDNSQGNSDYPQTGKGGSSKQGGGKQTGSGESKTGNSQLGSQGNTGGNGKESKGSKDSSSQQATSDGQESQGQGKSNGQKQGGGGNKKESKGSSGTQGNGSQSSSNQGVGRSGGQTSSNQGVGSSGKQQGGNGKNGGNKGSGMSSSQRSK